MTDTLSHHLTTMRAQAPLVQCITNFVAMNIAANVMLAAGASPAMAHTQEEAGEFAGFAGALTINIGTLSPTWVAGMEAAIKAANAKNTPWVLDPVAHQATAYRRETIARLMALKPTLIRGNASEIIALSGGITTARGADSLDAVEQAQAAAVQLALASGSVIAVTGVSDFVTDGTRQARISGGSALMPKVTALGCSLTCLTGAFAAILPDDPFSAAIAACAMFAQAGAMAGQTADGPGSFSWQFLDALAAVQAESLDARVERLA